MRYLKVFSRFLLNLPVALRLWIVILCTIAGQALFILLSPLEQNPCVLAIPIVVAAWIYRRWGTFLCLTVLTISTWIFFVIYFGRRHQPLTRGFVMDFAIGVLALLVVGLLVSSLRDAFERAEQSKRQLAEAYAEEQRLHQAKDQFIQNVNHELRTPLTALGGYLELLLEHNTQFDLQTRASLLQNAMGSCEELQLLVNTILESLQVSNAQTNISLTETDLASFIREVIHEADPRWQLEKWAQLEVPEDMLALAYPQYLRQLLRNLFSNAVKYASGARPILVSALRTNNPSTAQPEICISVKDFGPGIPPSEIQQLFGRFVRLQRDALGQVRGTGLGLSISKQLVEAMGGRIWVESSGVPGEGSCFSFTLPAISPRHTDPSSLSIQPDSLSHSLADA